MIAKNLIAKIQNLVMNHESHRLLIYIRVMYINFKKGKDKRGEFQYFSSIVISDLFQQSINQSTTI